jgi:hypothetical protein
MGPRGPASSLGTGRVGNMTRTGGPRTWRKRLRSIPRRWPFPDVPAALVLFAAYAVAFLIDEPLRRYTEANMNRALNKNQDKDKQMVRKVYERLVGGAAKVLENWPHEQVATRAEISGRLDNPQVSVVESSFAWSKTPSSRQLSPGSSRRPGRCPPRREHHESRHSAHRHGGRRGSDTLRSDSGDWAQPLHGREQEVHSALGKHAG